MSTTTAVPQTAKGLNDEAVAAEKARIAAELKVVEDNIAAVLAGTDPDAPALENDPTGLVAKNAPVAAVIPPTPPAAPAELPEQRYEYQLCDEDGRPMGGKQVIVYRTEAEKLEKLIKNQEQAVRQMRKMSREKAFGSDEPKDDAEKFQNIAEFKSRDLTSEERFALSQKLTNPETAAEARDLIVESAFGVKPEVLARTLNDTSKFIAQQRAVENYVEFVNLADGYYDSPANRDAVTRWMAKRNYAPTIANFKTAFDTLAQAGLLEVIPVVQQASVTPNVPVVEPPVVTVEPESKPQTPAAAAPGLGTVEPPQVKRHSHVPSGLNASVASAAGPNVPVDGHSVTLADIDKLPSDVYRAKLKDPKFVALVNRLESEAAHKRAEMGIRR
jgi:hypothetical protein